MKQYFIIGIVLVISVLLYLFCKRILYKKKIEMYPSGEVHRIFYTRFNKKHGVENVFYKTGELNKKKKWNKGLLQGKTITYFKNGEKYVIEKYEKGILVQCDIHDLDGNKINKLFDR
ncbi:putative antitoxin YwqK [termite gut metagenome]|uniref:Putative antitoxin YwqK n=1 Tax=termite gut metagenome TaxID=433724 RepID=A0A5J4RW93_9ZZZZ